MATAEIPESAINYKLFTRPVREINSLLLSSKCQSALKSSAESMVDSG